MLHIDAYADVKVAAEKKIQVEDNYSDKDSEIENTYVNNLDIDDEDKINLIDIKNLRRKIREMQAKKQFDEEFAVRMKSYVSLVNNISSSK